VGRPKVSFNYLGQWDAIVSEGGRFGLSEGEVGPTRAASTERGAELSVNARVEGGRLRVVWSYGADVMEAASIEQLATGYRDALLELIAHCLSAQSPAFTPSDFPRAKVSQKDLDTMFAKIKRMGDGAPK
jgi:non-ribosomal peptide synthase protein (TIGR01720 family)